MQDHFFGEAMRLELKYGKWQREKDLRAIMKLIEKGVKEVGTSRTGLKDMAEESLGTQRTRWQREFQERLTQAADAKDSAGNRLSMFCMRSSPKSSITATIFRLPLPDIFFSDRRDCCCSPSSMEEKTRAQNRQRRMQGEILETVSFEHVLSSFRR